MANPTMIQEYGNQFAILMDDGSKILAYPTNVGTWIVKGATTPAPASIVWPFNPASITSEWGYRVPPVPGVSDFHSGCDWPLAGGTSIRCAGDGVVIQVRDKNTGGSPGGFSWGNRVVVDHGIINGQRLYTAYAHMQDGGFPGTTEGATVVAGQGIGFVGSTGASSGDHLHFACFVGGLVIGNNDDPKNCVDPRNFMATYNPGGVIAP